MTDIKLPLKKRNIIITRSKDQMSSAKEIFQNAGATIFDLPALIIDYPDNIKPLDNALEELNNFQWIIFSSSNGIKFVENRLKSKGSSLKKYSKIIKIAVVGEKTSQYLNKIGLYANYIPPNFIAESLVKNFPSPIKGLNVFIPRVQTGGRSILSKDFIRAGAFVKEVAAYESKCPNSIPHKTIKAIKNHHIDAILFSSGKTVKNTAFLLQKYFGQEFDLFLDEIKLFSIGPQTSIECKQTFGRVDMQANKYTFEGLLEATINYFN